LTGINKVFDRRLLVAVDAAGYGGGNDQEHFAVQSGLTAILDVAAARANLRREFWIKQPAGDGELAILPRDEPEPVVVDEYVRCLDEALAAHNANPASRRQIRLRMAVHFGTAMLADNGYAGQGVVAVSRLVESDQVKAALAAAPQACLAVILSRQIFEDVVRQQHVSVPATDFAQVSVRVKEFQDEAWVKVVGVPHHAAASESGSANDRSSGGDETRAGDVVHQEFKEVYAPGSTFGISHGQRGNG
jgi:class 3 adenylate cyclase